MAGSSLIFLGAGLYWASIVASPLVVDGSFLIDLVQCGVGLAVAVLVLCISQFFTRRHLTVLATLSFAMCLVGLIGGILPVGTGFAPGGSGSVLPSFLGFVQNVGGSLLMLLWSIRFVSVSRARAFPIVSKTALLALALYGGMLIAGMIGGAVVHAVLGPLTGLLRVISAGVLIAVQIRYPVRMETRDFVWKPSGQMGEFVVSRLLLGVSMGFLQAIPFLADCVWDGTSPWSIVSMAVLTCGVAICFAVGFKTDVVQRLVLLVPFAGMAMAVLLAPDMLATCALLYPSVWLAWIVVSSIQLSELKYDFGMSDLTLALGEKTLLMFAVFVGNLLGGLLVPTGAEPVLGSAFPLMFVIVLLLCCYVALTLAKLSVLRGREEVVREVVANDADQLDCIYRAIARDFGLSERETEILAHLARGHTGAFISNELDIAPGTVRSHIGHIYKKTDCHAKEEIMALVTRYKTFKE